MSTSWFGRAFKITVTPQAAGNAEWTVASSSWETESVKVRFEIEQKTNSSWFSAEIEIWNFDPASAQVIQANDPVTVTAGYEAPGSGVIFSGRVFQPLWERVGEYDNKLTLHCLFGMWEDQNSYVSTTIDAGFSQADAVRRIAGIAQINVDYLDPVLSTQKYLKGRPFAGYARRFFDEIALSNHLHAWIAPSGVNIRSLTPLTDTPDVIYAPPYSSSSATSSAGLTKYILVGSPMQTELGIRFRTLLDSDAKLGGTVKLTGVVTKRLPLVPLQFQTPYSQDAVYAIAGIRHVGDSRGNEWNTEIDAVFTNWDKIRIALYTK